MAIQFIPGVTHEGDAPTHFLEPYEFQTFRLKAGPDAVYIPGPWVPYDTFVTWTWSPDDLPFLVSAAGYLNITLQSPVIRNSDWYQLIAYDAAGVQLPGNTVTVGGQAGGLANLEYNFTGTDNTIARWDLLNTTGTSFVVATFHADGTVDYAPRPPSQLTEPLTSGIHIEGFGADPDAVAAAQGSSVFTDDNTAYMGSGVDFGHYYEVLLTTATKGIGTIESIDLPNRHGPELQGSGDLTWQVHGTLGYQASDETDLTATSQLTGIVLKIALVSDDLVQLDGSNDPFQFEFTNWPTKAVLDGLTVVHSEVLDDPSGWYDNGTLRRSTVPFERSLKLDPRWFTNSVCHLAVWLERGDGEQKFNTHFEAEFTTTVHNTQSADPDGPLNYLAVYSLAEDASQGSGYDTPPPRPCGYWEKASGDEIWLAELGTAPGPRVGYSLYSRYGYVGSGRRVLSWTFTQVANANFGWIVLQQLWSRKIVVTPAQVLLRAGGVSTVLNTHSTPFGAGDVCKVDIDPATLTATVYRNDVEVSTFAFLTADNDQFTAAMPWAAEANAGNRMANFTTVSPPTHEGELDVWVDMDYGSASSAFTSGFPTAYRYYYAKGHPQAVVEKSAGDSVDHVVMWVRLRQDVVSSSVWFGWRNPELSAIPDLNPDELVPCSAPGGTMVFRREDGKLIADDNNGFLYGVTTDHNYPQYASRYFAWRLVPGSKMLIQMDGLSDFDDAIYRAVYQPDTYDAVSGIYDQYLRFDLGAADRVSAWWNDPWLDLQTLMIPRDVPTTPMMWKWEEGDDHNGYGYVGYAHNVTPLTTKVTEVVEGVALLVQDTTEGYDYGWRDEIIGYTDELGPFYYGPVAARGFHASWDWSDWGTLTYGDRIDSDNAGRIFSGLQFDVGRTGFHASQFAVDSDNFTTTGGYIQSPHYGQMFTPQLHGVRDSYASPGSIVWDGTPQGLRLTTSSSTTVDTMYADDEGGYQTYLKNLDFYATFNVPSEWAGLFIRGDRDTANRTTRWAINDRALIKIDGDTRTVVDSWDPVAPGTLMRFTALDDDIKVYANGVLVGQTTSTFNHNQAYLGIWVRKGLGDAARFGAVDLWTLGPIYEQWMAGNNQDGLVCLRRQWALPDEIGKTIKVAMPWPTDNGIAFGHDGQQPQHTVIWALWSPAYPDSLFVMVQIKYPLNLTPLNYAYRQFEIHRDTGDVIREMVPFVDPSVDPTNPSQGYSAANYVTTVSKGGTQLRTSFYEHPAVERVYDLATEQVVISRLHPAGTGIYGGQLEDGREMWWSNSNPRYGVSIYDPETGVLTVVRLENPVGRGYNGGVMGWDGKRYLWGGYLNYHVEPSAYPLKQSDLDRVPPGTVNPYVLGQHVSLGGGIAQAFTEIVRWDLLAAGSIPGTDLFAGSGFPWVAEAVAGTSGSGQNFGEYRVFNTVPDGGFAFLQDMQMAKASCHASVTAGSRLHAAVTAGSDVGAYLRLKVEQLDSTGTLLHVDEGNPEQYLMTAGGFQSTAHLDFTLVPGAYTLVLHAIFAYAGGGQPAVGDTFYADLIGQSVVANDGSVPVEYMFNLDHEVEQGYAYGAVPGIYGDPPTVHYWRDITDDAIEYRFPDGALRATFAPPAPVTEEPPIAYSRHLTDSTQPTHSDIGFTRNLP